MQSFYIFIYQYYFQEAIILKKVFFFLHSFNIFSVRQLLTS